MNIPENVFSGAVRHFWQVRNQQANQQTERGVSDQGARGSVTGGKQMDGFCSKIIDLMLEVGVDRKNIYIGGKAQNRGVVLPGFFRPTKEWDLLVVVNGRLLAAIELKSQVGPSFGNNFNNRTEEAMGTALCTWTAYREGAFASSPQPWLGYLFLLEDCPASKRPVRIYEPHFEVFAEFKRASYADRYELFCRKL